MVKKFPHTYVIVFFIILLAAVTTWIVPAGEFNRQTIDTNGNKREVIQPDSYHQVEQQPQTWQIFSAFYIGFVRSPKIIVFILILGGAFWILNESRAIDAGVNSFLQKSQHLEKYWFFNKLGVNNIIIALVMFMFSFFGAVFGMSEETIAFVIIFVPLAVSMGYDSIVGVCMCFIGAGIGFAGCLLNPFTLGIAQEIAGLPLFSGIEYRLVIWMVINVVGIGYVLNYAAKIKKNPKKSIVYVEDEYWRTHHNQSNNDLQQPSLTKTWIAYFCVLIASVIYAVWMPMNSIKIGPSVLKFPLLPVLSVLFAVFGYISARKSIQYFILNLLLFTIAYLMAGVMGFDWSLMEIAALFFTMALVAGMAMGKGPNDITKLFVAGAKDIMSAALVVGLAGGIIVILEDGKVIDTILHGISKSMIGMGKVATLSLMYAFQSGLNMVITSGTAKAALIMPILRDVSEMIGMSKQATVTAFHIGDGFTNLITPTSGVLIGVLEIARIPFNKWFRWAWPLILILTLVGFLLLIPTVTMKLNGF
ncbi:MAG: AbgT family transporter [Bacteroidota bacterium]|nr:short-chain fatty acid transporter [Odoribacter sp.]MDP3643942.1 AbgT family transporter [Bacteroidota bacterium]